MPPRKRDKIKGFLIPSWTRNDKSSRGASPAPSRPASPAPSGPASTHSVMGPVPSKNKAFEGAAALMLQNHIDSLSDDDKKAFQRASVVDVMEELRKAQHSTSGISDSLSRVQKALKFVDRFMGPLAILIQQSPEISSLVVGGLNCILMLGLGYIEFFESLTDMVDRIGGHLSYISEYADNAFQSSDKIQEALVKVYCDLLDFYVKVRCLFTNKEGKQSYAQGFKLFLRVAWEPFEEQFQPIETRFIDHTKIIVRLANVEHQILFKEENQYNQQKKRREILRWLSEGDFEETHDRHYKKRCKDTGQWLLYDPRLVSWRDGTQSSLLWCHGAAGSGKTVLASLVVERLSALYQLSSNTGVTFVYCNYKEPRTSATYIRLAIKQLCRRMQPLPSRLQQVYEKHHPNDSHPNAEELQSVFLAVSKHFNNIFLVLDALDECDQDQRKELCKFFSNIIELSATSALDTYNNSAYKPNSTTVKLFVTSRREPDIERVFRQRSFPKVEIEAAKVDHDIAIYVAAEIEQRIQDERLILRSKELKEVILTTLATKASGMFLWVQFQLDEICSHSQISDNEIKKALNRAPEDLNATYERILDSISKKGQGLRELARRVLIYIVYSRLPVHINLLRYAVSVEEASTSLKTLESSIPTEMAIVDACANLISIDRGTQLVRFVHFSVQEFLTRHQFSIDTFRLGPELANREIARMLITLLKILYSEQLTYEDVEKRFKQLDTLHEWPYYLSSANLGALSADDHMFTLVTSFFERSPPVPISPKQRLPIHSNSIEMSIYLSFSPSTLALMFDLPGGYEHYQPQPVYKKTFDYNHLEPICSNRSISSPIYWYPSYYNGPAIIFDDRFAMHYVTIVLDSVPAAKRLCTHGYPIDYSYHIPLVPLTNVRYNKTSGMYVGQNWDFVPKMYTCSPLCSVRSEKMAKFLLDNGVSTDIKRLGHEFHDPLSWLAVACNTKAFELVSDRIVYQHTRRHSAALIAILNYGYQGSADIIRLLISKGTDVNARGGAALLAAIYNDNIENIELLLDRGADVNVVGGEYGTSLQAAVAYYGANLRCIQPLLDRGADVNAMGGKYGTALQAAAAYSANVECIQLLLDRGADVNAMGGKYGTALQAAVCQGKFEKMKLLLDRGADTNAVGGVYGTALQAAVCSGKVENMQLLLDRGADVNALGGMYGTALQAAVCLGKVENMQLLLDRGANVNALGGIYGTTLQAAAAEGRDNGECVQLLLDRGADVNALGGKYGTALQAAAASRWDSVKFAQLLFGGGAVVNAVSGYGTDWQATFYLATVKYVQLLLDRGADVNAVGGKYGTALQAAACRGKVKNILVQLLLDRGANINAMGGKYGTALQSAAASDGVNVRCMQLLLDRGANVNAVGGKYGTALQAAACGGKVENMQLLLDRGADTHAVGGVYGTILQAAAASNGASVQCIQLLLDRGVDVNAVGGVYGTALQAAAASSANVECIQLLLDRGADVNAVGGVYGTALQAAATFNGANVEHLQLLPNKIDIDPESDGSTLPQASNRCRLEAVKLLLSRGADVNSRGGKYGTALQAALAVASPGKRRLINKYDTELWESPNLEEGSWEESEEARFAVLELLLDNGADITAYVQGSKYGDAPTAAYQLWEDDIDALSWFLALLESRGWKEGETAT